ncbi:hypothetical protein ACLOAV_000052 [Pseudogymnoascus australis]
MAPRYQQSHSIDAIIESPDEDLAGSRGAGRTNAISDKKRRDGNPSPTTTTSAHTKEKSRKSHRRSSFSSSRHASKSKPKANSAKRYAAHDESQSQSLVRQHPRHTRRDANSDSSSSSSEEEEEEEPKDYRSVLAAARGRLTSPSLLSTSTSLTTATNSSGGSSGSNSTITQASMSRTETVHEVTISGTTEEEEEGPLSPDAAAPDPPNVFAYLDEDSSSSGEDSDADENENGQAVQYAPHAPSPTPHPNDSETPDYDADSHSDPNDSDGADDTHPPQMQAQTTWLQPLSPTSSADDATPLAPTFRSSHPRTPSLSSASSFTASDTSSPADIDTDRSTSPEHSLKGSPSPTPRLLLSRPPATSLPPSSPTEAKLAAQMRAAQMRQGFHSTPGAYHHQRQQQHTPTPLSLHPNPYQDNTQAVSSRNPRPPPPSGYDALATHLTTSPPVYRRFATLNHRLLLHMQDELSELEVHLASLDAADAASRTLSLPPTPSSAMAKSPGRRSREGRREMKTHTHPSSRRAAAQHPSQLDHHRADLLARVGYKMAQYNATLTSFAKTSRLPVAEEADVDAYRAFLANTQPVVHEEARFLDQGGDLVSLAPPPPPAPTPASVAPADSVQHNLSPPPTHYQQPHTQRALMLAALASILLPVLMFTVVPNFVGRIAVAVLVAGMLWMMVGAQGA